MYVTARLRIFLADARIAAMLMPELGIMECWANYPATYVYRRRLADGGKRVFTPSSRYLGGTIAQRPSLRSFYSVIFQHLEAPGTDLGPPCHCLSSLFQFQPPCHMDRQWNLEAAWQARSALFPVGTNPRLRPVPARFAR